jgi:hypothetical protein
VQPCIWPTVQAEHRPVNRLAQTWTCGVGRSTTLLSAEASNTPSFKLYHDLSQLAQEAWGDAADNGRPASLQVRP